jgi:cytoplasmic iron level regulating protein YaaA (DUF328/UPF0246 family)
MRILLPPSEAKQGGGRGKPLASRSANTPLDEARQAVLHALGVLLRSGAAEATRSLFLPGSIAAQALADNARVTTTGTRPALDRYAGIVYDGLAAAALSPTARRLANRDVLVLSGLLGVVRGGDPVPNYRVPAKATLPGLGVAGTYWRRKLADLLPPLLGAGLIVDLRSSDYAAMWRPERGDALNERMVGVRVLSPRPDGSLGVISYPSKYHKGKLAAGLIERAAAGQSVDTAEDVIRTWLDIGGKDARLTADNPARVLELITFTSTVVC